MGEPAVGIGCKVKVIAEDVFRRDKLLKLYKKTLPANKHLQRVKRLHFVQLLERQEVLNQRRDTQVDERVLQPGSAKPACRRIRRTHTPPNKISKTAAC